MLDVDFKPTFVRTAKFQIPSGTGFVAQDCPVTFDALDVTEFAAFDLSDPDAVKRFLERVVVNMDELVDKGGNSVRFSTVVRDRLIAQDWARRGLVEAYVVGRAKAAEGN